MKTVNKKTFILMSLLISGCSTTESVVVTKPAVITEPAIITKPVVIKDGTPVDVPINVMAVNDQVPRHEKRTRAGNPVSYKVLGKRYKVLAESKGYRETGLASWYGTKFHGRKTSNGEIYDMYAMTAAHKTLPIPCYVRVTNLKNQRSVVVRVNDRGPFHSGRIIDLSYTAAVKLGIQQSGTGTVEVVALEPDHSSQDNEQAVVLSRQQQDMSIYLQMGVFSHLSNAQKLQQKLTAGQIKNVRIHPDHSQDLYKVQAGPLYSVDQIDAVHDKLVALGLEEIPLLVEQ